jgi:hypothetical protein
MEDAGQEHIAAAENAGGPGLLRVLLMRSAGTHISFRFLMTHPKPTWLMDVSTGCAWRAASAL